MTPIERFNVLCETPRGATYLLNTILDEYGAVDLLNAFFPGMNEAEQQRFIDTVHTRMFRDEGNKVRILDIYVYDHQRKTLRDWCTLKKLPETTVVHRLKRGWSIERALETPLRHATIQPGTCGY